MFHATLMLLSILVAWPVLAPASDLPPRAPALLTFMRNGQALFEVRFEDLSRFVPTRARTGAPKLALHLTDAHAEIYERFIARHAGQMVEVHACGSFLGQRRVDGGDVPGRIQVLFMSTERSRAYLAALESGGC